MNESERRQSMEVVAVGIFIWIDTHNQKGPSCPFKRATIVEESIN